jgi:hypothetical protein
MTQLDTAREIWQRLTAAGVSKGVTAGLLGNMQAESAIIADRWEGDRVGNLSGGYGLVQWTPATKYRDWAKARRMDPAALSSQITRIIWERDNNVQFVRKGQTFAQWAASNITPEQAADDFVRYYERPKVINSGTRQQFARKWYDQLSGTAARNLVENLVEDWFEMATKDELKSVVHDEVRNVQDAPVTNKDTNLTMALGARIIDIERKISDVETKVGSAVDALAAMKTTLAAIKTKVGA